MKLAEFIQNIDSDRKENRTESGVSKILLNILNIINSSLVIDDVLELVLKNAIELTNTDRGFIALSESGDNLNIKISLDTRGNVIDPASFQYSQSVVNEVFTTGESRFIEEALSGDSESKSRSIISLELQTILCAPLINKEQRLGVICVDSKQLNKIDKREKIELFEILARQAAVAIQNAQLHHQQLEANAKLMRAYRDLEIAKREVEKVDKLKSNFLSQMSHEIRTPINIIFGAANLLKMDLNPEGGSEQHELFEMVEAGGRRIMRTIEEILQMANIQAGDFTLRPEEINLEYEILKGILKSYEKEVEGKGLEIIYNKSTLLNKVRCDRFMLNQIFLELIDNAVKYTNEGRIVISQYENRDGKLAVSVKDTGIGMSEEYIAQLFKPFVQEDMGWTRSYEGNGLALAIVKKYADLNNMTLNVTSKKDSGTEFVVTFAQAENCNTSDGLHD